jgi:hypothetical protein
MNDQPMPDWDDYWPSLASAYANPTSAPESARNPGA